MLITENLGKKKQKGKKVINVSNIQIQPWQSGIFVVHVNIWTIQNFIC